MTTEYILITALVGILGAMTGALCVYFPLFKRMTNLTGDVAGHTRDIKTVFRDTERASDQFKECMRLHQETVTLIRTTIDQNNLLIQKVTLGA